MDVGQLSIRETQIENQAKSSCLLRSHSLSSDKISNKKQPRKEGFLGAHRLRYTLAQWGSHGNQNIASTLRKQREMIAGTLLIYSSVFRSGPCSTNGAAHVQHRFCLIC